MGNLLHGITADSIISRCRGDLHDAPVHCAFSTLYGGEPLSLRGRVAIGSSATPLTAKAYQIAPTALIGTFDYAYLVFACLWGYVVFHEVPDIFTWAGMALILIAGLLVIRAQKDGQ